MQVLSDPIQRMIYDEIHGYSLTSINPFLDESSPKDHVFVDEFSCIGTVSHSRNYKILSYMFIDVASLFLLSQLELFQGMLSNCTSNPWQAAKIVPM